MRYRANLKSGLNNDYERNKGIKDMKSTTEILDYLFWEALKCQDEVQLLTEILNKIDKSNDKERLLYQLMIEKKHNEINLIDRLDKFIRK